MTDRRESPGFGRGEKVKPSDFHASNYDRNGVGIETPPASPADIVDRLTSAAAKPGKIRVDATLLTEAAATITTLRAVFADQVERARRSRELLYPPGCPVCKMQESDCMCPVEDDTGMDLPPPATIGDPPARTEPDR